MSVSKNLVTIQDAKLLAKVALGSGYEVLNYSLKNYSKEKLGFLGSHQHLSIVIYERGENVKEKKEISFFVKALPYDIPCQYDYIQKSGIFEKEANFFSKIAPHMTGGDTQPSWGPRCYLVNDDRLIFEDLSLQGFRMRDKLFDEELIKSGIRALASLHASSIKAEEKFGKTFEEIYPHDFHETAFVKKNQRRKWFVAGQSVAIQVAQVMGLDSSKLPDAFKLIYDAVKSSKSKVNVISHGDLWANNLLFNDDEPPQCRLVDFQLFRYSPVGHDLAQFLYLCSSQQFRNAKEYEILQHYYRQLLEFLGNYEVTRKIPSWEEILQTYEEQRIAACATATLYFPTVLLDGTRAAEIMNDSENYERYCFEDRREIVLEEMKRDFVFDQRIREAVQELVEMSWKMEQFPVPC